MDWKSPDTDITTLQVLPKSEIAKKRDAAGMTYFDWLLLPPPIGATVRIYGRRKGSSPRNRILGDGAKVKEYVYPMRDHGMTNSPGFRLDREFDHGFSGGPIFYDNALLGIFSGPDVVALLWPLALMTYPDRAGVAHSFADHFDSGFIRARDWSKVKGRVERLECDDSLRGFSIESRCLKKHAIFRS